MGIDEAESGDTVMVSAGTYFENIILKSDVAVIGEGQYNTIIDGGNTGTEGKLSRRFSLFGKFVRIMLSAMAISPVTVVDLSGYPLFHEAAK